MTASRLQVTTAAFVRSTGRAPRGSGSWAFQAATRPSAFSSELVGEQRFFFGSFSVAKAALAESGATGVWAVLP